MSGKLKAALGVIVVIAALGTYFIVAQKSVAPAVALTTYQGQKIDLTSLQGKVVLVNFWATDCPTCIKEMPALIETHNRYAGQGYETVAVAMSYDKPGFVSAYALKNALPFKVAHDADGTAAKAFGDIRLTPTSFLIDKHGNIVKRYLGEPDFSQLHTEIEALLKEPV
ncbi:MAG TPA: TlpA disulfide reductase family protein [Rhodocyclaceae bacterium]|jgi:peroxiredoxin|nr:TlpA disulfide reductase family protein [Rhodocyclaceae bacterium]